jgi:hypothetical protein
MLRANIISGNVASSGVSAGGSTGYILLEDNLVSANTWTSSPSMAVDIRGCATVLLNRNAIVGNGGNGVFFGDKCTFTMTNNIVAKNQGMGIWLSGTEDPWGNPLEIYGWLYHNTLANNTSGGIRAGHNVDLTLVNNILVSHTVGITTTSGYGIPYVTADYTLYDGYGTYTNTTAGGTIVTTNDVLGVPAFVPGGYHITETSAAIDAGVNAGITIDIDKEPRLGEPDLGADEYWAPGALKRVFLPLAVRQTE